MKMSHLCVSVSVRLVCAERRARAIGVITARLWLVAAIIGSPSLSLSVEQLLGLSLGWTRCDCWLWLLPPVGYTHQRTTTMLFS